MTNRQITSSILVAAALACSQPPPAVVVQAAPAPAVEPAPLTFGLSMPLGVDANHDIATIVGDFLTTALDRPVQVRLFGYNDLLDALAEGQVDFASMTPLTYVRAAKHIDVSIVRKSVYRGAQSYVSVLFVRKDSLYLKLEDLAGKRIAWVQRGSASGNLVPRALLRQRFIEPEKFFSDERFLQDHGKVCQAVIDGSVDVGASFTDAAAKDDEHTLVEGCRTALGDERLKELRVVMMGDSIPNDVIIARKGLSPELVTRLGTALDALPGSADGLRVLHDGFRVDSYVPGVEGDFTALRQLSLKFPEDG